MPLKFFQRGADNPYGATPEGTLMDVSNIASAATAMSQQQTANAVQMAVLKKAMDIGRSSAEQLIAAIPQAGANPPNLGNRVDTYA